MMSQSLPSLCADDVFVDHQVTNGYVSSIEQTVLELHPLEYPEIIAAPTANGLPVYLDRINKNSKTTS